jgi:hypothetical protein
VIRSRHPRRRPAALAGLALVGLALSGCGSIGIHPGSAAVVGNDSVSMKKIDSTSSLYCDGLSSSIQATQTQQIPMRFIRQYVAMGLASKLIGQQLGEQYGVGPGPHYAQAMAQLTQQLPSMTSSQRQAVLEVESGPRYLQWVQVAVGQQLLSNSGQSSGNTKASLQRGQVATQDWANDNPVKVDPTFNLTFESGQFKQTADETSYPLSPLASQGAQAATASQANPAYTGNLPPSQVCG